VRTLSSVRPDLPPALDAIVARALERDPKARYASAAQMAAALRTFAADHGISNLNDGRTLMGPLFEAEFAEQRKRIATFFANGDSVPNSGTVAVRMLPAEPIAARPTGPESGGTQVSTASDFADELERHQRRNLRTLAFAFVPIIAVLFLLGYVVLNRSPSEARLAVPREVPQLIAAAPAPDVTRSLGPVPAPTAAPSPLAVDQAEPRASERSRPRTSTQEVPSSLAEAKSTAVADAAATVTHPSAAADFGYLTLDTSPWANVSVGGNSLGQTPVVRAKLPVGTHTVQLSNPERGISTTYQVTIQPGKTSVRRLGLD